MELLQKIKEWWFGLTKLWKIIVIFFIAVLIFSVIYALFFENKLDEKAIQKILDKNLVGSFSKDMGGYGIGRDYEFKLTKDGKVYKYAGKVTSWDQYSGKKRTDNFSGEMDTKLTDYESGYGKRKIWKCSTGELAGLFALIYESDSFGPPTSAQLSNDNGKDYAVIILR